MKKRIYRKVHVNKVPLELLQGAGARLIFSADVAKTDMVAAFTTASADVLVTVCWKSPYENGIVLALLSKLRASGMTIDVVMEPSGSYDDAFRHQLGRAGFPVHRVQGKRTHDAKEVHDGVPSLHDAKSAAVLAMLHRDGVSRLWEAEDPARRSLKAAISVMDMHREQLQRLQGRLESQLARYWPELCAVTDITSRRQCSRCCPR